jgi:hypothetical protein
VEIGPRQYSGWNMSGLLKAIRFHSEVTIIVESSDVMAALNHCWTQDGKGVEPEDYTSLLQWKSMMKIVENKGIQLVARVFDEEEDADFVQINK